MRKKIIKKMKRKLALALTAVMVFSSVDYPAMTSYAESAGGKTTIENPENVTKKTTKQYVSVHDPSIVKAYVTSGTTALTASTVTSPKKTETYNKDIYLIFGSHKAWSYSFDLENWTYFTNNINRDYDTIFAEDAAYSAHGGTQGSATGKYEVSGNLWAPDVIWNPTYANSDGSKGAWCMYMSVNGDHYYTSVVLLTAKTLGGNWTRQGAVVYSGFYTLAEAQETDLFKVIGSSEGSTSVPARYLERSNNNKWGAAHYTMNAIDPCVLYDDEGNLWMTYGSWFGGIYMLKLDNVDGMRDYDYTYTTTANKSDAYQGLFIAGGSGRTGEASYIQKMNGKYYLFMSYGGFVANGGYNMRVFAADDIKGPYVDYNGNDSRYGMITTNEKVNSNAGNVSNNHAGNSGMMLMSYYKWSYWKNAHVAQGHNSAFVDDDGNAYVVYHTRTNDGSEGHSVRVHQLVFNADNNMIAAPFEYSQTDSVKAEGYTTVDIAGDYEVILQAGVDYKNLKYNAGKNITLTADGNVTGELTGTWNQKDGAKYINLVIDGVTYKSCLIEQNIENTNIKTLCFTGVGDTNTIALWGYKIPTDEQVVAYNAVTGNFAVPEQVYGGNAISLATSDEALWGATYTWTSSDPEVLSNDGVASSTLEEDKVVTLTLTVEKGDYICTKNYSVNVIGSMKIADLLPLKDERAILAQYKTYDEFNSADVAKQISAQTGLSISFYVEGVASDWDTIATASNAQYFLHLAVLSGKGCDWYEAASTVSDYAKSLGYNSGNIWTCFKDKKGYVTVSYNTDNTVSYYLNGKLMLTYANNLSPSYPTGSSVKSGDVASAVVNAYLAGNYKFEPSATSISISGIVVGFAVDYDVDNFTEADYSNGGGYMYMADYDNMGSIGDWDSTKVNPSLKNDTIHNNYASLQANGDSANRGTFVKFGNIDWTDVNDYTIELDVALTSGYYNGRSSSTLVLTDSATPDSSYNTGGTELNEKYLFKLATQLYYSAGCKFTAESEPNELSASDLRNNWYVNKTNTAASNGVSGTSTTQGTFTDVSGWDKVVMSPGTWVHIKLYVTIAGNTEVVVTGTNAVELYRGTYATSTFGNGKIGGIYTTLGRGAGNTSVDNIKIYKGTTEPVVNSKISYKEPVYGVALSASDAETVSAAQWYYTDDLAVTGTAIDGATEKTYTPTKEMIGKYLYVTIDGETTKYKFPVGKAQLSVSANLSDKEYDGTKTAGPVLSCSGAYDGDTVGVTYSSATYSDAKVGNDKNVVITGISVTGADADCYKAPSMYELTGNIVCTNYRIEFVWSLTGKTCRYNVVANVDSSVIKSGSCQMEEEVVNPATCTADGETKYTASASYNGGEPQKDENSITVAALKHNKKKAFAAVAATCTADGNIAYWYCPICEKYFSDEACTQEITSEATVVTKTGHLHLNKVAAVAATCQANGNIEYWHCDDCDVNFKDAQAAEVAADVATAALNHANVQHVQAVAATTEAAGNIEYWFCPDCQCYFTDSALTNVTTQDKTVIAKLEKPVHTHDLKHTAAKAATCQAEGNVEYWYCDGCKKYFADEAATKQLAQLEIVTAKTGHVYTDTVVAPTCAAKGYTLHQCKYCGISYKDTVVEMVAHSFDDGKITKEPTVEEYGIKTYTCTGCGTTKTETIDKLTSGGNAGDGSGEKPDNKPGNVDVTGVSVNKTSVSVVAGKTVKVEVTVAPSNATDKKVTFKSSNEAVATVDAYGNIKGVKAGTATITVKSTNGKTASVKVTVTAAKVANKTLKITTKNPVVLTKGKTATIKYTITKGTTDKVTFKSDKPSVVKVSSTGKVTAKKTGTAKITVKCGTKSATIKVSVKLPNAKLSVSKKSVNLSKKGRKTTVSISVTSGTTDKISITNGNKKVITTKLSGKKLTITAKKKGSTTVTVKCGSKTKKITVKVLK